MRVPQVSERIKEAPAQALRGVFAGIGQLLLVTDKLRHKTPAGAGVPRTRTPEPAGTPAAAQGEPAADSSSAIATAAAPKEAVAETAVAETPVVVEVVVAEATEPAVVELVAAKPLVAEPAAATALVAEPVATEPLVAEPVAAKPAPAKAARTTARKPAKKPPARDFDKTGNVRLLAGEEDAEAAAAEIPAVPAETTPPLPNYDELSIASLRARLRNLDIAQLKQVADYERSHAGRAEVIAMFERRVAKLEAEPEAGA
jgi:hypothetical protein